MTRPLSSFLADYIWDTNIGRGMFYVMACEVGTLSSGEVCADIAISFGASTCDQCYERIVAADDIILPVLSARAIRRIMGQQADAYCSRTYCEITGRTKHMRSTVPIGTMWWEIVADEIIADADHEPTSFGDIDWLRHSANRAEDLGLNNIADIIRSTPLYGKE